MLASRPYLPQAAQKPEATASAMRPMTQHLNESYRRPFGVIQNDPYTNQGANQHLVGKQYHASLVIVYHNPKMAYYIPVQDTLDSASLSKILALKLALHGVGIPGNIVSNHGPQLT